MIFMQKKENHNHELQIPSGVQTSIEGEYLTVKGKLGATTRRFNKKYVNVKIDGAKLTVEANPKMIKKSANAAIALKSEIDQSLKTVDSGITVKMKVLYAHFPMSIEIKGKAIFLKNLFGEKVPRKADIIGDTKIEVKGQDVTVKGVDKYDVGQTIGNIRKACAARGNDTRVFQDGIYISNEE